MEQHLRAPSLQVKVARVDADRFGHAGAGSRQEEQKCPIAPAAGCRLIGGRDDGLDLGLGEVVRHLDVGPLGGDCQNALGDAEGGRIVGCDVMEEGSNSGKPGIARCDGVVPLLLELVEKGENEVPIEILERQAPPASCPIGRRQRGSACARRRDSWPWSRAWRYAAWPAADGSRTPGVAPDKDARSCCASVGEGAFGRDGEEIR